MIKCKIKDIVTLSTATLVPKQGVAYHLYSLPSYDEGKQREEVMGENILSNKFIVPDKCILFNKLNVRFKRVWRIDNTDNNKLASTEFLPLIVDEDKVDFQYCYYLLISDSITKYLSGQNANTSGSHKRISPDDFLNIDITLPEMEEQKRIGLFLSSIDKKIDVNHAINQNLEALAKQLYDYWFVQFDFPNEEGNPYKSSGGKMVWNDKLKREIPEGWEVKPLKEICTVKDGTHDSPKPQNEGLPLITSKHLLPSGLDFKNAYLISKEDFEAINKRSKVEQYDILFSMIGTIGNMYFVDEKQINFAIKNMALIKTSEIEGLMYYILYNLGAVDYIRYENNALSGSIQKFLSLDAMRNIPVLYNESILSLYNEKVRHYQELYDSNNKENKQLTKQRDELLPLLMNGQVTIE